ncbi:MAG TPA: DUF4232 domain-containing protein, partial [Acidimicrobiales bacterium]
LAGGTTVRLVLTSHYFPTCSWSYGTRFQFLSAGGAPVGPSHSLPAPASVAPVLVYDTFQVVESLSTMEGVRCTSRAASALAVTTPNEARLIVHFPETVGVCVNGTTKWTSLAGPTFPRPARCKSSALRVSIGRSSGAAGTVYYPIIFTNVGAAACVVSGAPSVQATTGTLAGVAHIFVGPRAGVAIMQSSGHGDPVRLDPAHTASATFGVGDWGKYTPSACVAKSAQSLSVGLGAIGNWWVKLRISVCTKLTSTTIWGVVPAGIGAVP